MNFQIFKLDLEKAEEPEIKLPTFAGSWKKQESSRKAYISALLTMPKPLCGSQQMVENSLRDGNTRSPYLPPEKPVCSSRRNNYNQTQNSGLVPHWEKRTSRLYVVNLLNLAYMYSTSHEMPGWMKHKLKSRFPGEISITSDVHIIPL